MVTGPIGIGFVLACIFVGFCTAVGIFTLFVRAENIERNVLVGLLTLATCLLAFVVLGFDDRNGFQMGTGGLISVCLLAAFGFGLGRVLDYLLGPLTHSPDSREAVLGADLAD